MKQGNFPALMEYTSYRKTSFRINQNSKFFLQLTLYCVKTGFVKFHHPAGAFLVSPSFFPAARRVIKT